MKLASLVYEAKTGWNGPLPTNMDSEQTMILAFAASSYLQKPEAIEDLAKAFPKSILVGCSTAGEIHGSQIFDESISIAIAQFEKSKLQSVCCSASTNSFESGKDIAKKLIKPDLKGVLILSDGTFVNGSELVRGLTSLLPPEVIISGGLAGDGPNFKETWVLVDKKPTTAMISAIGIYGNSVQIKASSMGGWDVFGPERLVTKSSGNILFELDGKPALTLYKEYLGERSSDLPASALLFPLSLRSKELDRKGLVRTVLAVDEQKQSMTFAGDIPQGSYAQLMKANFDRLVNGAATAAEIVNKNAHETSDTLAIAISCVGRRLVLGVHTEDETEATLSILPKGTQQVGFYSYGEISPLANGKCDLHNQTMTLTTLTEV
jgi:hypothetical protein